MKRSEAVLLVAAAVLQAPLAVRAQPVRPKLRVGGNPGESLAEGLYATEGGFFAIAEHGWDPRQLRINYRLLQVWNLLSLYFSCQSPIEEYIEPVPASYRDKDGEGMRITLTPVDATTIAIDPYPFDVNPLRIQLAAQRLKQTTFDSHDAFMKAYFQAPMEVLEFELVDGAQRNGNATAKQLAGAV